jgi:peptidoglycan/LPS O-acetylase OafA/YrhL
VLGPIVASIFFGQFPVIVFLLLSGFCLYLPLVRKNPRAPALSLPLRSYLARRWVRIAPLYYVVVALCVALGTVPAVLTGPWREVGTNDWRVIVSHLLLVHNVIPGHSSKIDYPMWSIGLEWQLYLLFPLLVWAFRRTSGPLVVVSTFFVTLAARAVFRHLPELGSLAVRSGPLAYLTFFAAGMFAASLTVERKDRVPAWVLGATTVTALATIRLGSGNGIVHDVAAALAGFCVLLLAADRRGRLSRALSRPWLVWIGVSSYSLYLVHAPLLHLAWLALRPLHLSPSALYAALIGSLVPIVGVSRIFHLCFERPFMRRSGRSGGHFPPPCPAPAPPRSPRRIFSTSG